MSVRIARKLRSNLTEAETRLWQKLRRKQLDGYRFRRQVPLAGYVADFACFEAKLIVEVDGGQHNDKAALDSVRTARLEADGFHVLRFWNNDVLENMDGVLTSIRAALNGHPPPQPSPTRGEGG